MAVPPVSRVWILTFFVMGVLIGLLLLVLQRGPLLIAPELLETKQVAESAPPSAIPPKKTESQQTTPQQRPSLPAQGTTPLTFQPRLCDRKAAEAVVQRARTLASISDSGEAVELNLSSEWEYYSPALRRSFVEAFSGADHCLQGRYRSLRLLYRGEEVARVGSAGKIEMK